jgi:hypothetical protein
MSYRRPLRPHPNYNHEVRVWKFLVQNFYLMRNERSGLLGDFPYVEHRGKSYVRPWVAYFMDALSVQCTRGAWDYSRPLPRGFWKALRPFAAHIALLWQEAREELNRWVLAYVNSQFPGPQSLPSALASYTPP